MNITLQCLSCVLFSRSLSLVPPASQQRLPLSIKQLLSRFRAHYLSPDLNPSFINRSWIGCQRRSASFTARGKVVRVRKENLLRRVKETGQALSSALNLQHIYLAGIMRFRNQNPTFWAHRQDSKPFIDVINWSVAQTYKKTVAN
jgi:hypothetical protein